MPEIRQDVTTKEWVIIAKERARRPEDFRRDAERPSPKAYATECPFCPGNEDLTVTELYRKHNGIGWQVRVVPNLYPALVNAGSLQRIVEGTLFHRLDGVGQLDARYHSSHLHDLEEDRTQKGRYQCLNHNNAFVTNCYENSHIFIRGGESRIHDR